MAITGQLWFTTEGNPADARVVRINSDGSNQTIVAQTPSRFVGTGPTDIGLDTAAGFYFALTGGRDGLNVSLVRGSIAGGAVTVLTDYKHGTTTTNDDDVVHALYVDPVALKIYVGVQDYNYTNAATSGIKRYSYDPMTGNITDLGYLVTVQSSGKPLQGGYATLDPSDLELDQSTGTLYFTETEGAAPPATGLYSLSLSSPNTITLVVSKTQFPDDLSKGFIGGVEVDPIRNQIYFDSSSVHPYGTTSGSETPYNPALNAIWTVPVGSNNATATKVALSGLPNAGAKFYPGGIVYDQQTNQLYVESEEDGTIDSDDVIFVFQLSRTGASTTGTLIHTFRLNSTFTGNINALAFNQLVQLGALSATTVTEQTASAVLSTAPTITDGDGGYLRGATVQITAGGFTGSGDVLAATTTGTSITAAAYNATTGTLSFSGYDTIAHYRQVIGGITLNPNSNNPTNFGANASRTITYTLDDGSESVGTGQQNSGTSVVNITAVNDAPTIANITGDSVAYTQNAAAVKIDVGGNATVADPDSTNFDAGSLTVAVGSAQAGDKLNFVPGGGITVSGTGVSYNNVQFATVSGQDTGSLSFALDPDATLTAVAALLHTITFATSSNVAGTRTINWSLIDGDGTANTGTDTGTASSSVVVAVPNVAPVNTVPAGAIAATEDAASVAVSGISVSDADAGDQLTVTLSTLQGTLTLGTTTRLSFTTGDGTADATMTFTATNRADLNTALASLTFTPTADFNGAATVTISTNDRVGGGGLGDSDAVTINVAAVADTATISRNVHQDSGATNMPIDLSGFENAGAQITGVTPHANTTAVLNNNGTPTNYRGDDYVVFTPNANYTGDGSFTYTVASGGVTETGTAAVTVMALPTLSVADMSVSEGNAGRRRSLSR